jgi:hypothetical protein
METQQQFYDRAYINLDRENAFIYSSKRGVGNFEIWKLSQVREYLRYLENKNGI